MNPLITGRYVIIAADNGFNPVWNETSEFEIMSPSVAFIRFVVNDEDMFGDSNFIGQGTYPVCCYCLFFYFIFDFSLRRLMFIIISDNFIAVGLS